MPKFFGREWTSERCLGIIGREPWLREWFCVRLEDGRTGVSPIGIVALAAAAGDEAARDMKDRAARLARGPPRLRLNANSGRTDMDWGGVVPTAPQIRGLLDVFDQVPDEAMVNRTFLLRTIYEQFALVQPCTPSELPGDRGHESPS